jgi:hypothetical protein
MQACWIWTPLTLYCANGVRAMATYQRALALVFKLRLGPIYLVGNILCSQLRGRESFTLCLLAQVFCTQVPSPVLLGS